MEKIPTLQQRPLNVVGLKLRPARKKLFYSTLIHLIKSADAVAASLLKSKQLIFSLSYSRGAVMHRAEYEVQI